MSEGSRWRPWKCALPHHFSTPYRVSVRRLLTGPGKKQKQNGSNIWEKKRKEMGKRESQLIVCLLCVWPYTLWGKHCFHFTGEETQVKKFAVGRSRALGLALGNLVLDMRKPERLVTCSRTHSWFSGLFRRSFSYKSQPLKTGFATLYQICPLTLYLNSWTRTKSVKAFELERIFLVSWLLLLF